MYCVILKKIIKKTKFFFLLNLMIIINIEKNYSINISLNEKKVWFLNKENDSKK